MMPTSTIEVTAAETVIIRHQQDVLTLMSHIGQRADQVDMNVLNKTKLTTAVSELTRNMITYANGGEVKIELIRLTGRLGLRLIFSDKGPGIADVTQAMQDGYSSGSGLGMGLPGAKRLMNDFNIESVVGQGTKITIIKWANG